ncbi:MAG: ribonuclease PH [Exilispira sp.]
MGNLQKELEKIGISKAKKETNKEVYERIIRSDGRKWNECRKIIIEPDYIKNADGSCLISYGNTKVICTAMLTDEAPSFAKDKGIGWLTCEYSMLPGSTLKRKARDRNKIDGRSIEIQRLIGRSIRGGVDLTCFPGYSIYVDTDVINADGGTRTASITGGFVATALAFKKYISRGLIKVNPIKNYVAAISIGIVDNAILLDLMYEEDEKAFCDMNVIATDHGELVNVSAESGGDSFGKTQFLQMLDLAIEQIVKITKIQKEVVEKY